VGNLTYEEFTANRKTIYAVVHSIEIIGETTKNIPEEIKTQNPDLPWKRMAAMRDKLVHGYFGIDIKTLYNTTKEDLLTIKVPIQRLIEKNSNSNKKEDSMDSNKKNKILKDK
jgi:uncharacterized protein with HEPN domain